MNAASNQDAVLLDAVLFPRVGLLDVISVSGADYDSSGLHAIEPIGTAGSLVAEALLRAQQDLI